LLLLLLLRGRRGRGPGVSVVVVVVKTRERVCCVCVVEWIVGLACERELFLRLFVERVAVAGYLNSPSSSLSIG